MERCLIVVCGLPGAGKTSISRDLGAVFNVHPVDIDDVRVVHFGAPNPLPKTAVELGQDSREMAASYATLLFGVEQMLGTVQKPVIMTATFSSHKWGQNPLMRLAEKLAVPLKVIWLRPDIDSLNIEEMQKFLDRRRTQGYKGALNDAVRLRELAQRYDPIVIPHHIAVPTWPTNNREQVMLEAARYCRDPKSGYHPTTATLTGSPDDD